MERPKTHEGILMTVDSPDFARAYEQCYPRTVRLLCTKGLRLEEAREFAQLAWSRAWERRTQLRDPRQLPSWVSSIAINEFRTHLRGNRREQQLESQDAPCVVENNRYGVILSAFYLFGYSAAEIGHFQKASGVAIRVRLSRACSALRLLAALPCATNQTSLGQYRWTCV